MEKKKQAQSIFSIKTKRENQNEKLPKSANELIDRVLIVQSIDVFNANESYDKIFIAAGNVIERCLRFYLIATITGLKIEGTSLFDMIRLASKSPEFPQDFIDYFTFVRKKGNKRHEELEGAKEIDLWILKLDYYKFLKWFVCEYLKKEELDIAKKWYADFIHKVNQTSIYNSQIQIKEISIQDEIQKINLKVNEHDRILSSLMKKSSNEKQSFENKNVKAIVGYHSEDNIEHPDINKDEIKKPEPSLEETISIIKKLLLKIDYDDGEMAVKYIDVVFDTDGYCIISYKKTDTETEEKPQVKYGLEWEKETVEKKYAKGVPLPKISKNISSKFRLVDVKTCILLTNQIYFNCHEHIKDFINQKRGKIEVFPTDNAYSYVEIKGKFISKMTNEFIIHINNRTTAERLQQAFLHAIKLAKSNKQKNEWFD